MNKWFAKIRKQENGSIAIFVAGLISIMMILFILVLNLGSVYAVKEKSATTAQQASLAATSAFYERVQEIVFSFDPFSYLPEEVEDTTILEPFFSLNFKIQERAKFESSIYRQFFSHLKFESGFKPLGYSLGKNFAFFKSQTTLLMLCKLVC